MFLSFWRGSLGDTMVNDGMAWILHEDITLVTFVRLDKKKPNYMTK